jgi:prophage antirepressor-like protein
VSVERFANGEFEVEIAPVGDSFRVIASGLARALGFHAAKDMLRTVPEAEKGWELAPTPGGQQQVWTLTEPGFYRVIGQRQAERVKDSSVREQVKRFQSWVYGEVLPSLRKHGSYSVAPALPDISTPQGVLALAERFADTARQLVEADAKVKELEPKALAHDTLMAAQAGDVLVRQAAKLLGWAEKQLRAFLIDEQLIYRREATCGTTQYDFYAAHADCFNAVERVVEHTWGSCAHYTLYVTPRGLAFVQMRIEKRRAEMAAAIEQAG